MRMRNSMFILLALVVAVFATPVVAQDSGAIEGRVTRDDGTGIGGVTVMVTDLGLATMTDARGNFSFRGVDAGTYSLSFTVGDNAATGSVEVVAGETARADQEVAWVVAFAETITVFSASHRQERIVEAPAAISVVAAEEIALKAATGQVPKLIEFTPGVEVTQSGVYDYNLNTRGFNSSLNRRVATIIDGRDPSVPFLGAQEWAAVSFPLDDIETLEMVRGPSAALYGSNASSGVINMTTKRPRDSQGGQIRITGGELSTLNADLRWAGDLGNDWYFKVVGGIRDHDDYFVSRRGAAEYSVPCTAAGQTDCLPQEAVAPSTLEDELSFFGLRVDKYFSDDKFITVEGGTASIEGPLFQTGIGRVQLLDVDRPWARVNFFAQHWNALAYFNKRDATKQTAMSSGGNLVLDAENYNVEVQGNWEFADGAARLVVGASFGNDDIDTFDPATGRQTLMFEPIDNDFSALFGQVDWDINESLRLVVAGRLDENDLHDSQFSPKAALVYAINSKNTLRFTYNEAFQVANYSEFFLNANAAPPADLSILNTLVCMPFGLDCGLGITPVKALGNDDLEIEEIQTFEIGYKGILGGKTLLTIDYYISESDNFITDLIPQLGTTLGRINDDFGPWEAPAGIPDAIEAAIRGLAPPILSNNPDGSNILAAVSYTNFGEVDSQGIDLGITSQIARDWSFNFTFSWFDFDIKDDLPGFDSLLVPNTPEFKGGAGFSYLTDRWNAAVSARWVDDFDWAVGPFVGEVKSYTTVDLSGEFDLTGDWRIGVTVSNLFDDDHYQAFGGDLLERRALVSLVFGW